MRACVRACVSACVYECVRARARVCFECVLVLCFVMARRAMCSSLKKYYMQEYIINLCFLMVYVLQSGETSHKKVHNIIITNIIIVLDTHLSGDSSAVITSDSLRKGRGFESRQEVRDYFLFSRVKFLR